MKMNSPIHCLLDCYASVLKEDARFDYRPLYVGAWNAYFDANEKGIYYYSDTADPYDWQDRFETLYGNAVKHWFDRDKNKYENYAVLKNRMADGRASSVSVVMADLYYLPYSNQYRSNHTPHYVIVKHRKDTQWHLKDPFFSWEGYVSNIDMWNAFYFMNFGMGFEINAQALHSPATSVISRLFEQEMHLRPSRLLVEFEKFVCRSIESNEGYAPKTLFESIKLAGVISKRFVGYVHAFEYFEATSDYCAAAGSAIIADLLKGWENLILAVLRYQVQDKKVDLQAFSAKVDYLRKLELARRAN
ncbi:hypothetical protein FPL14_04865 [Cohnella cholangitidis]|uniref:Butirosin biosynthesis protein H N-terminal domain-containing protein n=2 Tax=Cohnella cholangitidis TaxID=2598458 RepID=A0A7G5BUH5_9BACL|nr:hypothetical protein FPL14_04865 [Cohnella cholangitidis]